VRVFPRLARKERAREKIQKQLPWHFGEKLSCTKQTDYPDPLNFRHKLQIFSRVSENFPFSAVTGVIFS